MKGNTIIPKVLLSAAAGLLALGATSGCADRSSAANGFHHDETNGVYYWKTTLELDSIERDFLKSHDVGRTYVRFFDIVVDKSPIVQEEVVPNATLKVSDSIPDVEIIPTVYITVDALKKMKGSESKWSDLIVRRVANMCSYNNLGNLNELQLDCDWTESTDSVFFEICRSVRNKLQQLNPVAKLSATIRLHQLRKTAPPVDYGVLMLYNTGSFQDPEAENSILSVADVKPYLGNLKHYPLHLDFAYPVYSWKLIFTDNRFRGLLDSGLSLPESIVKKIGPARYEVLRDTVFNESFLQKGDIIREESVSAGTLQEVKRLIDSHVNGHDHSSILYHLDSRNIKCYTDDDFKKIYK